MNDEIITESKVGCSIKYDSNGHSRKEMCLEALEFLISMQELEEDC